MKSPEGFKPYSMEEAENEAEKMQEKIKSGKATNYPEAEKKVEKDKENEEKINNKLKERFGEIKIEDDLKKQILPYLDNETLTIANEYIAAVKTERSERGAGIGYWDQARVFLHDQDAMQEWNWRHKDSQHLDQKHLGFNSIEGIRASKKGDKIVITVELGKDNKNRNVNFEFTADKTRPPFKDGEIPMKTAKPTETYARKKIDEELEYADEIDEVQKIAQASGIELKEDDFRKVIKNILDVGLPEYVKKAQKVAKAGGFELTKDDYKNFVASTNRHQWLDAKGKFHSTYKEGRKIVKAIDVVAPIAKLSEEDYGDIINLILEKNKLYLEKGYAYDERIDNAEEIAKHGKLKEEVFHKIANAYIANGWPNKALNLFEEYNFKFTKDEFKQLANGFLRDALVYEYESSVSHCLNKAKELAQLAGIALDKEYVLREFSQLINDRPHSSILALKELDKISKSDKKEIEQQGEASRALENVKKHVLKEAEERYSFKPEMRSATSRTGNKPYEKPEITESVVAEVEGYGAFVLKEQIDHDTRFPQMRYMLYFVDKSGNEREIFEKHDYIDDGGGGSIYAENDPSITDVKISNKKIKFKVGGKAQEVPI